MKAVVTCLNYITLQEVTHEIEFLVAPENTMTGVNSLIGCQTTSRPGIKIMKRKYGIDLQCDTEVLYGIRVGSTNIDVSEVDDQHELRLEIIVTTGKLRIEPSDSTPIVVRSGSLA